MSGRLGYTIKNPDLLAEAFRHSSYVNESGNLNLKDNERLEFLGDAVLDLAISHILMDLFQDAREGDLSKCRATLVDEKGLHQVARELGLGDFIKLGKGEALSNGREKPSILANAMEALLGALYLDGGFAETMEIIRRLFLPLLEKIDPAQVMGDFKSLLQEYTQETFKTRPAYLLMEESGPPHDRTFKVVVRIKGTMIAEGEGKSKKEAEQLAAKEAFFCLQGESKDL